MEDLQKQVDNWQEKIMAISSKYEVKIRIERNTLRQKVDLNQSVKEEDGVIRNQEAIITR
ncbi:unnamed protein product [Lupinus luteus]|uniref:Uncharacterized protein n=1 Tax=Lupinus luteus TaxID=3873 RepID=A0AAV1XX22_LUPLU